MTLGGILGHMVCTGAAVIGGRHLAAHINEKTVGVSALVWCGQRVGRAAGGHGVCREAAVTDSFYMAAQVKQMVVKVSIVVLEQQPQTRVDTRKGTASGRVAPGLDCAWFVIGVHPILVRPSVV